MQPRRAGWMEGKPLACLSLTSVSPQPCSLPHPHTILKEPLHLVWIPCPVACPSVQEVVQLPTPWDEGSECEDGFFQEGGDCIVVDYCSCLHNGQNFPVSILLGPC